MPTVNKGQCRNPKDILQGISPRRSSTGQICFKSKALLQGSGIRSVPNDDNQAKEQGSIQLQRICRNALFLADLKMDRHVVADLSLYHMCDLHLSHIVTDDVYAGGRHPGGNARGLAYPCFRAGLLMIIAGGDTGSDFGAV